MGQALVELSRTCRLDQAPVAPAFPTGLPLTAAAAEAWLAAAAEQMGVQLAPVDCRHGELRRTLSGIAPALIRVPLPDGRGYLAVARSSRDRLEVLTPEHERQRVRLEDVRRVLSHAIEIVPSRRADVALSVTGVASHRSTRARDALIGLYLSELRVGDMWMLRADPGSSFARQLRHAKVWRIAALAFATCFAHVGAILCAWWLLGRGALNGELASGWLWAWALLCLSAVPLQVATHGLGAGALQSVAVLLKQRLLCGALRLDPDRIRRRGSGRLLAMVFESEAIEAAGLGGVFSAAVGLVQLASAGLILALGANGSLEVSLLLGWILVLALLFRRAYRLRVEWTEQRFSLANGFVENVLGHRTRVAQQAPARWHERDDRAVERYLTTSRALDRAQRLVQAVPARGFVVLAVCGLVPALLRDGTSSVELAIAVGGMLQAQAALTSIGASALPLLSGLIAWRQIDELYRAAATRPRAAEAVLATQLDPALATARTATPLLEARGVSFRYCESQRPVVDGCSLALRRGDRVLLEGPSGGGKSTLAALLVGMRKPDHGQVLFRGLDRATLGDSGWRRCIASAPQFHENHVLSGTLAFNLLMGRTWPASPADLAEAEQLCRELGLGDILDRMPSGLHQVIGETGWQLSHGERSRLFLARALLQRAQVVILDESFGALDPWTLSACMESVRKRASALLVIAHP